MSGPQAGVVDVSIVCVRSIGRCCQHCQVHGSAFLMSALCVSGPQVGVIGVAIVCQIHRSVLLMSALYISGPWVSVVDVSIVCVRPVGQCC